jgi:hypothetical protein
VSSFQVQILGKRGGKGGKGRKRSEGLLENKKKKKTYPVTVEEIRVPGIDITSLHGNQVFDEFVCWIRGPLEEGNGDLMELVLQCGISPENWLRQ